jgi:tetratricopeptide (TPR) repeat protein
LALLAQEAFGSTSPPIRILATDISGAALAAARAGRYRPRAVRELNDTLLERYFTPAGDGYEVDGSLRTAIEFRRHNLVHDPIPPLGAGPFELIVCRNVLIYFEARTVDTLVSSLEQALSPGGTLLLGAADALCTFANRPIPPLQTRVSRPRRGPRPGPRSRAHAPLAPLAATPTQPEPLDAEDYFLRGLAELEARETKQAVVSLRRALYLDPHFGLAAFTLARAHDIAGDTTAARRSYKQALRCLEGTSGRHEALLEQVDVADLRAVCRTRLEALR